MATVFDGVPTLRSLSVEPGIQAYQTARAGVRQDDAMNFQKAQEISAIVSRAAQLADTPEKWATTIQTLQTHFPNADLSAFTDFRSRDTVLAQLKDPYKDAALANDNARLAIERTKAAATSGPKTSLVPIWGQDAEGNNVLGQPNDHGELVPTKLPPNFNPSKGVEKIDAGTEWLLYDKQSGTVVGRVPKDVAGAAAATAVGTGAGTAAVDLPKAQQQAAQMLTTLEQLKNHPALPDVIGGFGVGGFTPIPKDILPPMAGTPGVDAVSLFEQVKGQAFLQAFQSLKGGGQITEVEGAKATAAMNRLNRQMSPADFKKAIDEIEEIVQRGLQRAQLSAAPPAAPGVARPAAPAAAPSGVVDFKSYFGNP